MDALAAPAVVAAGLLVMAGAQKVLDPTMTVGAMRALRLPVSPLRVRAGAAAEAALGLTALVMDAAWPWWLVAASYSVFAAFVWAARRAGTAVGTCGCFGKEDTPPHLVHVAVNAGLAAGAIAIAAGRAPSILTQVQAEPLEGAVVVGFGLLGAYLTYAVLVDLPRTIVAGRRARQIA